MMLSRQETRAKGEKKILCASIVLSSLIKTSFTQIKDDIIRKQIKRKSLQSTEKKQSKPTFLSDCIFFQAPETYVRYLRATAKVAYRNSFAV